MFGEAQDPTGGTTLFSAHSILGFRAKRTRSLNALQGGQAWPPLQATPKRRVNCTHIAHMGRAGRSSDAVRGGRGGGEVAPLGEAHGPRHGVEVGRHVGHLRLNGEGGIWVFEAVAGDDADDALVRQVQARGRLEQPGHAGGGRRLSEDALLLGKQSAGRQDLVVGHGVDGAAGLVAGGQGAFPARRVADAYGGGDRLRVVDRPAADDGGGAGRTGPLTSSG
jgi:hypothetical protein